MCSIHRILFAAAVAALLQLQLLSQSVRAQTSAACPTYDASAIRLVTFDTFAALMDLETSLNANVASILPDLSASEVGSLVSQWENAYGNAADTVFDEGTTGAFPFSYHISTSLKQILESMQLTEQVSRDQFDALVKSWGQLTPWTQTQETLEKLVSANFTIAPLSNGDSFTLTNAMKVFTEPVQFSYIFSSDFPVGAFKPQAAIYEQTLKSPSASQYAINEVLHVAGSPIDASGARDASFFSVLLHNQPHYGDTEPCFVLADITGLPAVLGI